jgi:hypothetical protein
LDGVGVVGRVWPPTADTGAALARQLRRKALAALGSSLRRLASRVQAFERVVRSWPLGAVTMRAWGVPLSRVGVAGASAPWPQVFR